MKKKIIAVYISLMLLLFTGSMRVLYLAVNGDNAAAAVGQNTTLLELSSSRGVIFDRNGVPITNSETEYIALCTPSEEAIAAISELPGSGEAVRKLLSGKPAVLTVPEMLEAEGITVYKVKKSFSKSQLAVHLIGYLEGDSNSGIYGLQKSYNSILRGGTLKAQFSIDGRYNILEGIAPEIIDDGYSETGSVRITVDSAIQRITENAAKKYIQSGAVVVLDVKTGKILASVSLPDFSPDNIAASIKDEGSPLINRAFTAYNVGSVFKLVVAAAALDKGISPALTFDCAGKMNVGTQEFRCHDKAGHGVTNMPDAISRSCNLYFIKLAGMIGAEPVYNMSNALGFGYSAALCSGITPGTGHLTSLSILKEQPAALANFAFGQGDLMLTPLQIATLTASIANGGKAYTPTLIEEVSDSKGNIIEKSSEPIYTRVMSAGTAALLREYMIKVVNEGTGTAARPENTSAGGKTGTAETGWVRDGRKISQAWFAGFFPAESPEYAISVIMEDGESGGRSAGPVFKEIVEQMMLRSD